MKRRARVISLVSLLVFGVGVVQTEPALAQSAADKATARQLATDGIQLFQKDRFADALDKLDRAQSLFDAPVHLLYIARCHAKLNHLVEAAEAYRKLVRTELSAKAPQTFKDAVADGQKELPEIEPKIPSLRVDVVPANAKDLRLSIDGESVSTAVLGVDRPINPGSHLVEVSSAGQAPVSRRIDIPIASKQVVRLELPAAEASGPTGTGTGGPGANDGDASTGGSGTFPVTVPPASDKVDPNRPTASQSRRNRVRIVGAIDVAGLIPFGGKIDALPGTGPADDRTINTRFGIGGGGEARLGVSIPVGQLAMTPLLFLNAATHVPGSLYNASADKSFGLATSSDSVMETKPISSALGLAVRFDTAPQSRYQLGGFGELGLILRQAYTAKATWLVPQSGTKCKFTEEFSGAGVRLRGGVLFPVSDLVSFVGSAGVAVVTIRQAGLKDKTCNTLDANPLENMGHDSAEVPADRRAWHAILGANLGVEFGVGL